MRYWMYHPENNPDGQIFDTNDVSQESLEAQGWVDHPAKFGHDVTGQASARFLAETKARHEAGGGPAAPLDPEALTRQQKEIEDLKEKLALRDSELEGLHTKLSAEEEMRQAAEKARDEMADAARGSTRTPSRRGKTAAKQKAAPKTAAPKKAPADKADEV